MRTLTATIALLAIALPLYAQAPSRLLIWGDMAATGLPTGGRVALYTFNPDASLNTSAAWRTVSVNIQPYSEQADNAVWSKANISVTADDTTDPVGGSTADRLTSTTSGTSNNIYDEVSVQADGQQYVLSGYVKAGNSSHSSIALYDNTASTFRAKVTVSWSGGVPTVEAGYTVGTALTPENVGGGWYRLGVVTTTGTLAANANWFLLYPGGHTLTDENDYTFWWGMQCEPGDTAASTYEKTEARDTYYDWSGHSHSGQNSGPTDYIVSNKLIALGNFDGTDDNFIVSDHDDFSFGDGSSDSPFSLVMLLRPEDNTSVDIIRKADTSNREWAFYLAGDSKVIWVLYDESESGAEIYRNSSSVIPANQWSLLVLTYDGSGSNTGLSVYLNGASDNGGVGSIGSYTAMENLGADVKIGVGYGWGNFDGQVALAAVYNRELSVTESTSQTCEDVRDKFASPRAITITCP